MGFKNQTSFSPTSPGGPAARYGKDSTTVNRKRSRKDEAWTEPSSSTSTRRLDNKEARYESERYRNSRNSPHKEAYLEPSAADAEVDEFGRTVSKSERKREVNPESLSEMNEEEQLQALIGISSFGSTKGTDVDDNNRGAAKGAIAASGKRQYRQYMNRKTGFNQKLAKLASTKKLMK